MATISPKDPTTTHKTKEASFSRYFFLGMALLLTAIVIVGFWPTYFGHLFLGQEPAEFGFVEIAWPIHLHAAVFVAWMVFLIAQTVLIARGKTRTHMRLGRYGMTFGLVLILVGAFITFVQMQVFVSSERITWIEAPLAAWESWLAIMQFAVLLGLGYAYRTRPEAHKRYMLLATIGLVRAANARIYSTWLDEWGEIIFFIPVGPAWMLLWIYDLYTERRIHPATLIGTAILLLGELLVVIVRAQAG